MIAAVAALSTVSCSDFLDTTPKDALSPKTTWKTEADADNFLTGCYDYWEDPTALLYWDCGSDFGYNNFEHEGFKSIGNGTMTQGNPGWSFYDFGTIRRVNEFLDNVDKCSFSSDAVKEDMKAQARFIRAYRYFVMNWNYGGVPIIKNYANASEAQVPRNSEEEVKTYINNELDDILRADSINAAPAQRGRIAKGAVLALRMRSALYYEDWAKAKECAEKIIALNQYSLDPDYKNLFTLAGQSSPEIILATNSSLETLKGFYYIGVMYNNAEGGWSSIVPTTNLVDEYEMANGMTKDEAGSGYDATHPFNNRDPRMAMTIIYPGRNYVKPDGSTAIFNTLDKTINGADNANYYNKADNSSKTALTWAKYTDPITQYNDIWNTSANAIIFRYAEVLLSYAEASNEINGPADTKIYDYLDMIRTRAGMPAVDRAKYNTKDKLRELIHRERAVELAGEGLRRADILRWKTSDGNMLATKVLNGVINHPVGTVSMDTSVPEGMRATINVNAPASEMKVEDRKFNSYNRYLPIPEAAINANKNLKQNEGYN